MPINDELKNEIRQGVSLQKIDPEDLKKREEEKRKRVEELKRLVEKFASTVPEGE